MSTSVCATTGVKLYTFNSFLVFKITLITRIWFVQVVLCGSHLDDNNWHSIHYSRRAHEIRLTVDNVTVKSITKTPPTSPDVKRYWKRNGYKKKKRFLDDSDMEDKITLKWQGLLIGGLPPKDPDAMASLPSFIGSIQRFVLNKIDYFELAKISTRGCKCKKNTHTHIHWIRVKTYILLFR